MSWISLGCGGRKGSAHHTQRLAVLKGAAPDRANGAAFAPPLCPGANVEPEGMSERLVAFGRAFFRIALVGLFVRAGVTTLVARVHVAFLVVTTAFGPTFVIPAATAHATFDLVGAHTLGIGLHVHLLDGVPLAAALVFSQTPLTHDLV